jgi:adenylate cyclase
MARMRSRDVAVVLLIALAAGILGASPLLDRQRGLSIDLLTDLSWRLLGQRHAPSSSPVVVVALDEETYRTPPFAGSPNVTWTGAIGNVLGAVLHGGAKVAGFDVVLPVSIEQAQIPFGEATVGDSLKGFDRDFLRSLAAAARAGKLALGKVQHGSEPLLPSPGQRVAVGQDRNIRFLNLYNDPDDIVRRAPLSVMVDGARQPTMAVELAARASGSEPQFSPDGAMTLGAYRVPVGVPNTLTLNFDGGDDIPTYSLADLYACAAKGDAAFFHRQFDGKVVLIGTVLDVEDRLITSKRFATVPEGARAERCASQAPPQPQRFSRDSVAGVYVQATAVANLLRGEALATTDVVEGALLCALVAAFAAVLALMLTPVAAALAYAGAMALWTGAAVLLFRDALALPLVEPLLAGLGALAIAIAYRVIVADKDKQLLRNSFALYLAPALIDRMMASSRPPALGGETRVVTVFFSDIAGFSALSETMTPADLVALMNEYLSEMTDIIEAHGGFVDKYVGDAIIAIFGAPVDDVDHAASAVRAALACQTRLESLNRTGAAFAGRALAQRIGLNAGEALIGNIGSRRRFNYTAMGDAVNLASRLEGANRYFATSIIASETVHRRCEAAFAWRELDAIRVKGRGQPVRIYEPLALKGAESAEQAANAAAYAEGLRLWRERDFAAAAKCFSARADQDPPSALFSERALRCAADPPAADWEPVNMLEGK